MSGFGGFVEFGDGSEGWKYFGAELAAERPLSEAVALTLYARIDSADEANFLRNSSGEMRDWGGAVGLRLTAGFEL